MADVRAIVARMWDACPVRRTLYFYTGSIKQAACHGIGRKRDWGLRRWTDTRLCGYGLLRALQHFKRSRQHLANLRVADLPQRRRGGKPFDRANSFVVLRASFEPMRVHKKKRNLLGARSATL